MILFLLMIQSNYASKCTGFESNNVDSCECRPGTFKQISASLIPICLPCAVGTFSDGTTSISTEACVECPEGMCANSIGSEICVPCPTKLFLSICSDTDIYSDCTCGPGYSKEVNTKNRFFFCRMCQQGFVKNYTSNDVHDHCTACPIGTHAAEQGSPTCELCASGTYMDGLGRAFCYSCDPGSFTEAPGMSFCMDCPAGKAVSTYDNVECVTCPHGQYAHQDAMSDCMDCAAGTYSRGEGTVTCTQCPPGTTSNTTAASSIHTCTPCALGTAMPHHGSSASGCPTCSAGKYSGEAEGSSTCKSCGWCEWSYEGSTQCNRCTRLSHMDQCTCTWFTIICVGFVCCCLAGLYIWCKQLGKKDFGVDLSNFYKPLSGDSPAPILSKNKRQGLPKPSAKAPKDHRIAVAMPPAFKPSQKPAAAKAEDSAESLEVYGASQKLYGSSLDEFYI